MQYGLTRFLLIQCLLFSVSICERVAESDIGLGKRYEDSSSSDTKRKTLFMIALPFPFHFEAMMYIAEAMQSTYDLTVGIFKPISIAEKNEHLKLKTFNMGAFPIDNDELSTLTRTSYHATSSRDYYSNHLFRVWLFRETHTKIGKESLDPLYREMDSYLRKYNPSLVLCDLFLPGIQIAAHAHHTPLLLFSPEGMSDFFPMRDLSDSLHYTEMSLVTDDVVSFMNNYITSLHLPPQPPFLYSAPLLFFDGVQALFASSPTPLPPHWVALGPSFRSGAADLSITGQILSFLHAPHITTRVLLYVGSGAGFDLWQIKTIVGGLQDPSIGVIILGTLNPRGITRKNVMIIDSARVSPFHLLSTYSITAVISYCDSFLVESALYSRIPLLCIPSRRNRHIIRTLQKEQRCVVFPEGFWTESTVRDCLRQAMNVKKTAVNVTQWEEARETLRQVMEELPDMGGGADDRSIEEGLSHVVLVVCVLLIIGVIWHELYQVVRSSRGRSNSHHMKKN